MTLSHDQFYQFIFLICCLWFDKQDWPVFDISTSAFDKIMEIGTNKRLFVRVAKMYFEQILYEISLASLSKCMKSGSFFSSHIDRRGFISLIVSKFGYNWEAELVSLHQV